MGETAKGQRGAPRVATSLASIILENDDVLDVAARTHGSSPAPRLIRNLASWTRRDFRPTAPIRPFARAPIRRLAYSPVRPFAFRRVAHTQFPLA
jgi:hypothetical protein